MSIANITCMRKTCCLIALSLLPLLTCPSVRAEEISPQLSALSPIPNGVLDTSTIGQVLIGHWVSNNGATHYYFGQEQVIIVNQLRRSDNSIAQHKQKLNYEVAAISGNWVQLELQTPLGWAQTRRFRLADDRRSAIETMEIMGHLFRNDWTYVDDRQQP